MNLLLYTDVQQMLNADASGLAILLLLALGTFVAGVHTLSWQTCVAGCHIRFWRGSGRFMRAPAAPPPIDDVTPVSFCAEAVCAQSRAYSKTSRGCDPGQSDRLHGHLQDAGGE
jgi:hypothetical protein